MKFSVPAIIATAAFLPAISAHLVMVEPKQWTVPVRTGATVETSDSPQHPLQADGSNFPCQGVAPEGSVANYEPGGTQTLQLQGSAVHSGGSGQMSITYDGTPSSSTKFRVMTSWEGGHPMRVDGNLTPDASHMLDPIQFKVPAGLPAGKAIVAWTWFNKSGNREMYMKCATVTIGGSETSKAAFEALPEMFRANSGNGCTVPEGVDAIKFKNPGPYFVGSGTTTIDCDSTQAGSGSSDSGSSTVVEAPVVQASAASTPLTSAPSSDSNSACTEGAITCNADGTWSLCGSGTNHMMGAAPAGTTCQNGAFVKRSVPNVRSLRNKRFEDYHKRRRIN
ncbi:hypothetical protein RUND412_000160 [Rhizina undulata]